MSFARHLQSVNIIFLFLLKSVTHALSFSYRKNKHVLRLSLLARRRDLLLPYLTCMLTSHPNIIKVFRRFVNHGILVEKR